MADNKTPIDETKVDHAKGAKDGAVKLDSDTPPQSPKAAPLPAEAVGGSFDPDHDDPMELALKAQPKENVIPAQVVAGATDYRDKKYVPGPAPGDIVIS